MPWGIVSLVDLYVGFTIFSLWICHREPNKLYAAVWVFFMMTLGTRAGSGPAACGRRNDGRGVR
eukprot:scaffold1100_cov323-Prasinococcus_capsulatus_cf.AAC.1